MNGDPAQIGTTNKKLALYRLSRDRLGWLWNRKFPHADVAQLVERELPKLEVAGSRPVVRFRFSHCKAKNRPQLRLRNRCR